MKKALVILLALTMVMSMFAMLPFGASAAEELAIGEVAADYKPEGTAIKTAEEFAAMAADGKYYLANDITVSATYANDFVGTFDGNGHQITTTVPLFDQFNGTAMNLTIDGNIATEVAPALSEYWIGAFANLAGDNADVTITNIVNKASLSSSAVGMSGIVGRAGNANEARTLVITNCANYGNIVGDISTNKDSGGIVGYCFGIYDADHVTLEIRNCYNYGTMNAGGRPGGIIGNVDGSAIIADCYNAGDIQSNANYCGGIAGRVSNTSGEGKTVFVVENCVNDGNVSVYQSQGGGIIGYIGRNKQGTIKNCTNNGDVYCESWQNAKNSGGMGLGGIIGANEYKGVANLLIEGCVNNGTIGIKNIGGGEDTGEEVLYQCGGIAGQLRASLNASFKVVDCTNNGDVYADFKSVTNVTNFAGGIAGRAVQYNGEASGYTVPASFVGCINNGYIQATKQAAGIVAHVNTGSNNGYVIADRCGNSGDIYSPAGFAAGLFGEVTINANSSKKCNSGLILTNSFSVGNIYADVNVAAGLVAYTIQTGADIVVENCFVAGTVESGKAATAVTSGAEVKAETPYSIETATKGTLYFMVPATGTITLEADDTLTYTANSAASFKAQEVKTNDAAALNARYTFKTTDGKLWATYSTKNGTITITESKDGGKPTFVVDGVEMFVTTWNTTDHKTFKNWQTFSEPITKATALVWNRKNAHDVTSCYVLEGVAGGLYSHQGYGNGWYSMEFGLDAQTFTADDLKSGKLAKTLNDAIGEDVFRQNLDAELFNVDLYPTTDKSHAKVVEVGGVLTNEVFDTTNDSGSPSTGDATIYVVVALAVSTISLAAVAVVRKNKEN